MVRSVSDATRFTATVPFAHSKTPLRGTVVDFAASAPPAGETPQQKVARLRALAQKAKLDNVSTMDKVVATGRTWADRAHRFTTLSLIGFTGIAFALTIVGAGQLVYNSRQRKAEWLLQQRLKEIKELGIAYEAQANGTVTEEQALVINQSLARKAAEAEKANKKGMFSSVKEAMFSGLSNEEKNGVSKAVPESTLAQPPIDVAPVTRSDLPPRGVTASVGIVPPQAQTTSEPPKSKGWYQWITRQ